MRTNVPELLATVVAVAPVIHDPDAGAVPPVENFYLPVLFDNAPAIMLKITDANGCSKFKILECRYGCGFTIQVVASDCIYNIILEPPSCDFTI